MLVPLLFLVPQIYNLGNYLAAHTSWGAYLPQSAGELFAATIDETILGEAREAGLTVHHLDVAEPVKVVMNK